jgi:hypothetical protein
MKPQDERIQQAEKILRELGARPTPLPLKEAAARRRMLAQASRLRPICPAVPRRAFALRFVVAACLVLLALGALTGAAAAADRSVPGDPLYPLDLSLERLALSLASRPTDKVALLLSSAYERLHEFEQLNAANTPLQMDLALAAYEDAITRLTLLIESAAQEDQPALVALSAEALSEHEQHLLQVRQDAPENAIPGLDRAIDAVQHGQDKVKDKDKEHTEKTPGPPEDKPEHPTHPDHPTKPTDEP